MANRPDWPEVFLKSLAQTSNVLAACRTAGVDRKTAYRKRERDQRFREAWESALEEACDLLELEARRRALQGTEKPVFHQGEECGRIREYSDTLMIFLLKAHRPERYRESRSMELDVTSGGEKLGIQIYIPDNGRDGPPDGDSAAGGSAGEVPG